MHIPRVVCSTCKRPLEPHKNGVRLEMLAQGNPYYKINADEWICQGCGIRVFVGFGREGIEHWDDRYDTMPVDVQVDL